MGTEQKPKLQICWDGITLWRIHVETQNRVNRKGRYSWKPHLRATGRYLPYGITQCYLPPDTSERAPPNPSHAVWYSIYLPRRDGRLSWPSRPDSAPAGSRNSDLSFSITSPTPNRCTTKTTHEAVTRSGINLWPLARLHLCGSMGRSPLS